MRTVGRTNRFKKEYQRHVAGTPLEMEFAALVKLLVQGTPLPAGYRDHPLKGTLAGCRDFHLRSDLVVIYQVTPDSLKLFRVGTHNELFGR